MIGPMVAAWVARISEAGEPAELSQQAADRGEVETKPSKNCIGCSGSGFLTGPTGTCTTDVDCRKCHGTGKTPKYDREAGAA